MLTTSMARKRVIVGQFVKKNYKNWYKFTKMTWKYCWRLEVIKKKKLAWLLRVEKKKMWTKHFWLNNPWHVYIYPFRDCHRQHSMCRSYTSAMLPFFCDSTKNCFYGLHICILFFPNTFTCLIVDGNNKNK